ncbi:MAG: PIN domain nuclease [Thermoleophilia bacterium]|nr:PIN domain nuclease [Thermoleophilia bacterium]
MIALERGSRHIAIVLNATREYGFEVQIPTSALAQVWRGGPRSAVLARLVDASKMDPLDERRAKQVGSRLGARDRTDLVDCHVVCCALERRAMVATSDVDDLGALTEPHESLALIAV